MTNPEQKLIEAATRGDRVSQEQLLLATYDPLLKRIQRHLPPALLDRIDAEDVMQLVMTKAFLHINDLKERNSAGLRAWLNRLADNEMASQVRHYTRQKRGGGRQRVVAEWDDQGSRRLWHVLQADESTASQKLSYAESREALHRHLAELPVNYRRVVLLKYFQELSVAEIALKMGRSEGAVRGLLARARYLLRQHLDSG